MVVDAVAAVVAACAWDCGEARSESDLMVSVTLLLDDLRKRYMRWRAVRAQCSKVGEKSRTREFGGKKSV